MCVCMYLRVQMTRPYSPVNKDRSRHTQYISPSVHSRPPHSSCSGTWQTYLQRNGNSCAFIGVVKVTCVHHNWVLKCRVCQWASLTRHFAWTLPRTYIFHELFTPFYILIIHAILSHSYIQIRYSWLYIHWLPTSFLHYASHNTINGWPMLPRREMRIFAFQHNKYSKYHRINWKQILLIIILGENKTGT